VVAHDYEDAMSNDEFFWADWTEADWRELCAVDLVDMALGKVEVGDIGWDLMRAELLRRLTVENSQAEQGVRPHKWLLGGKWVTIMRARSDTGSYCHEGAHCGCLDGRIGEDGRHVVAVPYVEPKAGDLAGSLELPSPPPCAPDCEGCREIATLKAHPDAARNGGLITLAQSAHDTARLWATCMPSSGSRLWHVARLRDEVSITPPVFAIPESELEGMADRRKLTVGYPEPERSDGRIVLSFEQWRLVCTSCGVTGHSAVRVIHEEACENVSHQVPIIAAFRFERDPECKYDCAIGEGQRNDIA
jgi:hypothetical protein